MRIELSDADMCFIIDGAAAADISREGFVVQLVHAAIGGRRSRLPLDYLNPLKTVKYTKTRVYGIPCLAYEDEPLRSVLPDIDTYKRDLVACGALIRDTVNYKRIVMIRSKNTRVWCFRADSLE